MQAETDTSAEAVERLARDCDDHAQWLRDRTPEGGTAGLAEVYDRIGATLRALHTRAQQAEAERDKARAALKPFVVEADRIDPPSNAAVVMNDCEIWQVGSLCISMSRITYGDLRAARAALGDGA